ncbi:MAG: DUF2490 domain-containing protein [Verrucomicrobiota bacterium]
MCGAPAAVHSPDSARCGWVCCHSRAPFLLAILFLFAVVAPASSGRADDELANEYRLTLTVHHPIKDGLTGFGEFEYRNNPEKNHEDYELLWPGLTYSVKHWLQLSGGLISLYTDNEHSADKLELRPFAGVKLFVPNKIKWSIYNFTRYEYRDTEDLDTHTWSAYSRLRSRFGVEFPLTSREKAWQPKTWYGLADVEPVYRFDHETVDPVYVRGGLGHVLSDRVRLEFVYYAQFTRTNRGSLEYADNIFQLNIKIGLAEGLLRRLHNPRADD